MELKVGDKIRLTGNRWGTAGYPSQGSIVSVVSVSRTETGQRAVGSNDAGQLLHWEGGMYQGYEFELVEETVLDPGEMVISDDAVNPDHYKFPGGIEVRQISAHLTSFGGQALQYIARSTRLDGKNKGEPAENIRKAIKFLEWELERLEAE